MRDAAGRARGRDEPLGHRDEAEVLRAGDLQDPASQRVVPHGEVDERRDIVRGDEIDGVAPRAEDQGPAAVRQLGADDRGPGLQVRGRPDDRPLRAAGPQRLLGGVLGAVQRHGMLRGRAQHRHQDDLLDAGGGRRPDQGAVAVAVDRLGTGPAGPDEAVHRRDHRSAAAHGGGDRGGIPHVARHRLDGAGQMRRSGRVTGEHPRGRAPLRQQPDHLCPQGAGSAGHQDHDLTPSGSAPVVPTTRWV